MNKLDLASNNQQWSVCHKTKPSDAEVTCLTIFGIEWND